jgi:hypothetical protein
MSIDFDDRIKEKTHRPRRWTVGRVANDLAIIMVAVPLGVYSVKGVTNCGSDLLALSLMVGLIYLGPKLAWKILKPLNDAFERHLTARDEAARSRYLAEQSASTHKPPPLDDF